MTLWTKFKKWLTRNKPVAKTRTITLPNGRTAIVDERGNIINFKPRA